MINSLSSLFLAVSLSFGPPVNYPISLAGNFGEPRPNHFHGGIDVRTGQVEGKPIFSVADGYVCRITVGLDGFGNAVYVRHPGGITTVYCHLKKFIPQLAAIVRKWQYRHHNSFADVSLRPTDFPVARGQLIAVSGNTGASKAPHLHLEFHDTRTWSFLDPLRYLKDYVKDTTAPIAHAFMVYPVNGEGLFCGSPLKQTYGFASYNLTRRFTAWGKVGFGIWANDYMEGSYGILGVYNTTLDVDGQRMFESTVDSIPYRCNRMVNSWGDYDHYCRTHLWFLKSFSDPGNTLPILRPHNEERGIITFDEERNYNITYTVTDVFGNSRRYSFTVKGQPQDIPARCRPDIMNTLRYDRLNVFQRPGLSLKIPAGMLPDNIELRPEARCSPGALSDEWSFYGRSYPLFGWAEISLKLKQRIKDPDKLYIVSHYGADRYMGGRYHDGWVTGNIRELGARYEIAYDDEAPELSAPAMSKDRIRVAAYDRKSGLQSVKGYVDGCFVLFEHQDKSNIYVCQLAESPIKKTGKAHELKLVATDNRNNRKVITHTFEY